MNEDYEYKVEIRKGISVKETFPDAKHVIEYAFSIGKRNYFRFDDLLNLGYDRALKCLVYFRELSLNCDTTFLLAHTQAIDNLLLKQTFTTKDLLTIQGLNSQLKLRLELPKEPDLMYKLASVVFFDQYENPQTYEYKYGAKKIAYWKKTTSLTDFFLQKPLKELIPYLQYLEENLEHYSNMTLRVTRQALDDLLPLLSTEQKMILQNKSSLSPVL